MLDEAITKLNEGLQSAGFSQKGKAVANPVIDALISFCRQNSEFAQAIAQSDKSVKDCIESTVEDCGTSLSDVEAYRRAADFWFSGAKIHVTMTIDLGDGGASNNPEPKAVEAPKKSGIRLSLDELLGM